MGSPVSSLLLVLLGAGLVVLRSQVAHGLEHSSKGLHQQEQRHKSSQTQTETLSASSWLKQRTTADAGNAMRNLPLSGTGKKRPTIVKQERCTVCQGLTKNYMHILDGETTLDEVRYALDQLCDVIPSNMVAKCDDSLAKYGDQILGAALMQQMSMAALNQPCRESKLCPDSEKERALAANTHPAVLFRQINQAACSFCTFAIDAAKQYLMIDDTLTRIQKSMLENCRILPDDIKLPQQVCFDLVMVKGRALVKAVTKSLDSTSFCADIGACEPSSLMKSQTAIEEKHRPSNSTLNASAAPLATPRHKTVQNSE